LIETLIALLLLAIGLLSLGFLQVLNVRYTASAEHRTVATNLATEVLDMMRSNPRHVVVYSRLTEASFGGFAAPPGGCSEAGEEASSALNNIDRWRCHVTERLPGGRGSVAVEGNDVVGYTATVTVSWADDVGREDDGEAGQPQRTTTFQVSSLL
jgi:type IV pilus assembly protein PilV